MLADRLAAATVSRLEEQGIEVNVQTFELRDVAGDIMNNMLTGFLSPKLEHVIDTVTSADGLIAVTPIFTTSYSGLFKSFFDVIDNQSLSELPVVIGATAGTPRNSLALDYAIRPMFTYLHSVVVPTSVFAASEDWGSGADTVKTLPERIERAAGELPPLVAASQRSSEVRDPFAFDASSSPVGGLPGNRLVESKSGELQNRFRDRSLCWKSLHRRGAIETVNADGALENICGIRRCRNGPPVTQHDHVASNTSGSLRPVVDERDAIVEGL